MITVRQLTFGFSGRLLFEDLSLTLPDRGLVAVTGPNGVGKTTLLRVLGGTYRSSAVVATSNGDAASTIYLDDEVLTLDTLTVDELVRLLAAELSGVAGSLLRTNPLVTDAMRRAPLGTLSLGQRQRCVIAIACSLSRADVVLLDEPFNALDADGRVQARRQLSELASRRLVLIASHLVEDLDLADSVLRVGEGGQVALASTGDRTVACPS